MFMLPINLNSRVYRFINGVKFFLYLQSLLSIQIQFSVWNWCCVTCIGSWRRKLEIFLFDFSLFVKYFSASLKPLRVQEFLSKVLHILRKLFSSLTSNKKLLKFSVSIEFSTTVVLTFRRWDFMTETTADAGWHMG